jgi:transcriptional regulator with XRE-family HTH domain
MNIAVNSTPEVPPTSHVDGAALGMNPFAALMPNAARAEQSAANDDEAPTDQMQPANGHKRKRAPKSPIWEGRAEMQLRSVVSRRLVAAREASGLRQHEAAREIGYSTPAQLSQWEKGSRCPPVSELVKVARLYGTTVDFLLGEAPEMDRDPAAGLRNAVLNGVRKQLERVAEITVDEVSRHARLVGSDAGSTGQFITAGAELLDAVRGLERLNPGRIDDMRGGATLARRLHEFESALLDAQRRLRLAQALDNDLRERLGRLTDSETLISDED